MQSLVRLHMIINMMIDDTNQILANFKGAGRSGGNPEARLPPGGKGYGVPGKGRGYVPLG